MTEILVADNLAAIRNRVAVACSRAGRPGDAVQLVAVSKRIDLPLVAQAIVAGQLDLGENRLPEGVDRQPDLQALLAEGSAAQTKPRWHFIGHLQSRKAAQAVGNFCLLHGVDSLKLAGKVANQCQIKGVEQPILLEVNVTGEEQKHGLASSDVLVAVEQCLQLPGLDLQGFMCMGRHGADEKELRGTFSHLRQLAEKARAEFGAPLPELSMGMSGDFEWAIAEGATMIRVGSAIFGPRLG